MKTMGRIPVISLILLGLCLVHPALGQTSQPQDNPNANEGAVTPAVEQQEQPPQNMEQAPAQTSQPPQNMSQPPATTQTMPAPAANTTPLPAGKKTKINGVIVHRNPDSLVVRTATGGDAMVRISDATKVQERKSNPFRGAKKYNVTQLMRGLSIEAEGRTDSGGALVADKIRFTNDEYNVAQSVESRVTPVEAQVKTDEGRISASEANQQRLSGEIEELNGVANAARGSAKNAQRTADMALDAVHTTNDRINALDDYQVRSKAVVHFKVGSARLSPEAKQQLDEVAQAAGAEKGYVIEVAGFASSDGNEALNRELSRKRAEAVVDYLETTHNIPLRRITMPFGYGDKNPAADNGTREGRQENRRVEVSVLVSKGLSEQPAIPSHTTTETPITPPPSGEARR